MKRVTKEEWLDRCYTEHGDRYDYSEVVYTGMTSKVKIICEKHGPFWQKTTDHSRGANCPKCAIEKNAKKKRVLSDEQDVKNFIAIANIIHGNRYDYSLVKPKAGKVDILCPKHGKFSVPTYRHLKGIRCNGCASEDAGDNIKKNQEYFLLKSQAVHGERYDYSKSIYSRAREKLEVVCRKHGSFWVSPDNHYKGKGCKECHYENLSDIKRYTREQVMARFKEVHGDRYGYGEFVGEYKNQKTAIEIFCSHHGKFIQSVSGHSGGSGCLQCATKNTWDGTVKSYVEKYPHSFIYLMEIVCNKEAFLKVGLSIDPDQRMKDIKRENGAENIVVIDRVRMKSSDCFLYESKLHSSPVLCRHVPAVEFAGMTECYSMDEKDRLSRAFEGLRKHKEVL